MYPDGYLDSIDNQLNQNRSRKVPWEDAQEVRSKKMAKSEIDISIHLCLFLYELARACTGEKTHSLAMGIITDPDI